MRSHRPVISAYFETPGWGAYVLATILRLVGIDVLFFDAGATLRRSPIARLLVDRCGVRHAVVGTHPLGKAHSNAIELADRYYSGCAARGLRRAAATWYRSQDTDLVFKRVLAEYLVVAFGVLEQVANDKKDGLHRWAVVIPGRCLTTVRRVLRRSGASAGDGSPIIVPLIGVLGPWISATLRFLLIMAWYRAAALLRPVVNEHDVRRRYRFGVSILQPFFSKFRGGLRELPFLVDAGVLPNDQSVFLIEYPMQAVELSGWRDRGYHVHATFRQISRRARQLRAAWILDGRRERRMTRPVFRRAFGSRLQMASVISLLSVRYDWGAVLASIAFREYIYTNKESAAQIALSCLFETKNIYTWSYSQFVGGPHQTDGPNTPFDSHHVLWSFLKSDEWLTHGPAFIDSMRCHRQQVRRYRDIGSLFSDMIAGLQPQDARARLADLFAGVPRLSGTWIGVFDTSYMDIPGLYSSYEAALAFVNDMIDLADRHAECAFLFKPSKPDARFVGRRQKWASPLQGASVVAARRRFAQLSNAILLPDWVDPALLIAASDLVITDIFSSPSADALAAGVPAFWYSALENTRDYPYALVPDLVAQGRSELDRLWNRARSAGFVDRIFKHDAFRYLVISHERPRALALFRDAIDG